MTRRTSTGMNPLPSLIKASAFDAANLRMLGEGRKQWNDDDWNAMCETQERLITACYSRADDADPRIKYIRFSLAGQLEQERSFTLDSDFDAVLALVDDRLATPIEQEAA